MEPHGRQRGTPYLVDMEEVPQDLVARVGEGGGHQLPALNEVRGAGSAPGNDGRQRLGSQQAAVVPLLHARSGSGFVRGLHQLLGRHFVGSSAVREREALLLVLGGAGLESGAQLCRRVLSA